MGTMPDLDGEIRKLKAEGKSLRRIAAPLNMSHESVRKRLKAITDKERTSTAHEHRSPEAATEPGAMSAYPKGRRSGASVAARGGVNPLSTKETASIRSGEGVNPRQRPRRGLQRGENKAPHGVFLEAGDLLSSMRELVEARGMVWYRLTSDGYEAYQINGDRQTITLYVHERKTGSPRSSGAD